MIKIGLEINFSPETEEFLSSTVCKLVDALKPQPVGPCPQRKKEFTVMSRFKLADDQPDFEINLLISGKDSEGHPVAVPSGATIEVDNSNETAIIGTLKSTTPGEDGTLAAVVGVHVADPSPDLGVISYKLISAEGGLLGAGSDEFLVGTGAFSVADIKSTVPFTPEPEAPAGV